MVVSRYSVDIDPESNTSHAVMLSLIGGSKRVLDVGCAAGDLARALRARGCTVSGVELDADASRAAAPDLARLVVGDLAQLDLAEAFTGTLFDVVVFGDVLEHLTDPLRTLRQVRPLLAQGGYVVVSVPNVAHVAVRLALLQGRFDYRDLGLLDATHVHLFTRRTLLALLSDAGLAPADIRRTTAGPFDTEIEFDRDAVPPGTLDRVLEDPDALTYQFVLTAVPDDADGAVQRMRAGFEARIAELEAVVADHARDLRAGQHEAVGQEQRLTTLRAETSRLRSEAVDLVHALRRQTALAAQERSGRLAAQTRVDDILGSTAWRVSAPVRALGPLRSAVQGPASSRVSLRDAGGVRGLVDKARQRGLVATARSVRAHVAASPERDAYRDWVARHDTLSTADRQAIRRHGELMTRGPLLSVVVPVYDTGDAELRAALDSVLAQLYTDWELCVVDDASPSPSVWATLCEYASGDSRVRVARRDQNGGIVSATNDAIAMANGDFVVLLDHDDVLPEHALYMVAVELERHPDADLIYSDEDKLDSRGRRYGPYFKPDFNLELLLGQNMVSHLGVYRTALLRELGGLRPGFDGSQDHDLALRVVSATSPERIRHIPRVLYHWRQYSGSGTFSSANPDRAASASRRAVADFLERAGEHAEVVPSPSFPTWNRVQWSLPNPAPSVAVVIPTRDGAERLRNCLTGLLDRTDYPDVHVVVMDNGSVQPETRNYLALVQDDRRVRVLRDDSPFNYSALNNHAVDAVDTDLVLLLNDDVVVIDPGWLREMVSLVSRPGVGAVGAKLVFEDGLVQHGGVVLGLLGIANHAHKFVHRDAPGSSGRNGLLQEMTAVTGACLLTRRDLYLGVGGLDADELPVAYNDVDYCLRIRQAGWRVLWSPHAELLHLESASRGADTTPEQARRLSEETAVFRRRWAHELQGDPMYNPNLSDQATDFSLSDEPRTVDPWSPYLSAG